MASGWCCSPLPGGAPASRAKAAAPGGARRTRRGPHQRGARARAARRRAPAGLGLRRGHEDRFRQTCRDSDEAIRGTLGPAAREWNGDRTDRCHDPERPHQLFKSTRRSSSSFPGWRIASTWSPAWSSVDPSAISARPFRITEISLAPSGSGTAPAATAGFDAGGVGYALDGVAKTDLLVAYEPWQAHPVRFVLASVLRFVLSLYHDSSPPRMGCQKDLVGCPRIQQRGCHRASPPSMGVHEGQAQLGRGRSGKFRPGQGERTRHKRRRDTCSA